MTTKKRKRGAVREHILDLADASIVEKGFANTSLEELIVAAGISRNGLYYHFKSKEELAVALIQRQREQHISLLHRLFKQAEALHEDPLEIYLVFTELFLPVMENARQTETGVLVSAYAFQDQHHNRAVRDLVKKSMLDRRNMILGRLMRVAETYRPRPGFDVFELANLAITIVEGGIIVTDLLEEQSVMHNQLHIYREVVRHAFSPSETPDAPSDMPQFWAG